VLSHKHVQLRRSLSHCVSQENHLEYHIISTLCIEETSTSFHLRLRENDTPNSWASPHSDTQHSIYVSERNHTPNSWASSPHTGSQCSISVSERNHTPISWAHPTHGLSLRSTYSVCVQEDVSRSYNHQHSLSAREAFSTRPSLSPKYSNFVFASSLVKMFVEIM
jgi:hypothetical protein